MNNEVYKVLIVDDEPFILNSMRRLFRGERFDVVTANSAEEALRIVREQKIQVVLTDNVMPGVTGVDLIKQVRSIAPRTIRMIISGQSQLDAVLEAVNQGEAFRFILKPWNDIDLKATINIALAHYRLQEENERLVHELRRKSEMLDRIIEAHPDLVDTLFSEFAAGSGPTAAHSVTEQGDDHATRSR